jgi:phage tail tape-measure protein
MGNRDRQRREPKKPKQPKKPTPKRPDRPRAGGWNFRGLELPGLDRSPPLCA